MKGVLLNKFNTRDGALLWSAFTQGSYIQEFLQ